MTEVKRLSLPQLRKYLADNHIQVPELERLANTNGQPERRKSLPVLSMSELVSRVESSGSASWLIEQVWPSDAYGVVGAEDKAGKSWAVLDLAISVATGTEWLGHFKCGAPGTALMYLGEGGERATLRRIEAIMASRGGTLKDVGDGLGVCFGVPRLTDRNQLGEVAAELVARPDVRLIVLDPLYLAAAGTKGSDLYAMGEVLGQIQKICQAIGAALCLTTHWNKSGEGGGAKRFTGVGPGAWGRVLGSAAVEQRRINAAGGSDVSLKWEFTGSEIADVKFRMRRQVRAENPSDLDSSLVYEVEVSAEEGGPDASGLSFTEGRVLATLEDVMQGVGLNVREIGDRLADDRQGNPLTKRTIQRALTDLSSAGLIDGERGDVTTPGRWWKL